jgi:intracellular multiplication protein IcmD
MNRQILKKVLLALGGLSLLSVGSLALAASGTGIGGIAANVTSNLGSIAKLITAGAVVKFKAHKDNPTQITIGMPIALLFVAAALIFIPSVFKTSGQTLFGGSGDVAGVSGVTSFTK